MKMKEFGPPGGGGTLLGSANGQYILKFPNPIIDWRGEGWLVKGLVNQREIESQYFVFQMRLISLY